MAKDVIMPVLGMNQDTGLLVTWHKQAGDTVEKGEPLMDVETDKAVMEIEAPAAGILTDVRASEGEEVPVGDVIAVIATDAAEAASLPATQTTQADDPPSDLGAETSSTPSEAGYEAAPTSTKDLPAQPSGATVPTGGVRAPRPLASPLARRTASERGVDLETLAGSGPYGAVLVRDVPEHAPPTPTTAATGEVYGELESRMASAAFLTVLKHADAGSEPAHTFFVGAMVRFLAASLRKRIDRDPDEGVHIETRGPDGTAYVAHADLRGIRELAGLVEQAAIESSMEQMHAHAAVVHAGTAPIDTVRAPDVHAPMVLSVGRLQVSGDDGVATFVLNLRHSPAEVDHATAIAVMSDLVQLVEDPASLAVAF